MRYLMGMACVTSLVFGMSAYAKPGNGNGNGNGNDSGSSSTGSGSTTDEGSVSDSVTVYVKDNRDSTYKITLESNEGNSWTYKVVWIKGRDLSHWDLALGSCLEHVEDAGGGEKKPGGDPSNANPGPGADESVKESPLIKWDTEGGTFTITLDADYPAGTVSVLAKTATMYGTGKITGPDCSSVMPPEQNACVLKFDGDDPQYSCYEERYDDQTSCEAAVDSVLAPGTVIDATWYAGKTCAELRADGTIPDDVELLDTLVPVELSATDNGVQIGFNRSADSGNLQFKLWKAHVEVINSIDSTDNENDSYTLTDENVIPGELYCYGVEAIDGSGQNNFNEIKCVIAK